MYKNETIHIKKPVAKKGSWWRVLLTIIGLLALALVSAIVSLRFAIKGEEVSVPALEGQSIVTSLEQLNSLNLRVEIEDQQFHPSIPVNHIISQNPPAGSTVKTGRKIQVVLSRGSQFITVPPLSGKSFYQVQSALRKAGLLIGRLSKIHSSEPSQEVIAQSPAAGSPVAHGSSVNLLLSQGPAPDFYLMPDFIGQDLTSVRRQVKIMNLSLGEVKQEKYQGLSPEIVINQSPQAGFRIQQGNLIDLIVSAG